MSSTRRILRISCSCARAGRVSNRPDPFDEHRNEKATTRRMAWATTQVKALLDQGWEVYTVGEVRLEHEAWTRRMQPPKGQRTRPSVDRKKTSQSFSDALPDQQKN